MAAGLPKGTRRSLNEFNSYHLLERAAQQGLRLRTVSYPIRALIFGQGDPSEELYFISEGLIKVVHILEDGRPFLLRLCGAGDFFGKSALIGTNRQAYAQTLQPACLLRITPKELTGILAGSPESTLSLIRSLAQEAHEYHVRLVAASRGCVQEQLAVLLWFLQKRFARRTTQGVRLELKLSCELLAEMLGHSRQRVNEALSRLQGKGLVQAHYGQIVIKDLEGLRALAKPFLDAGGGRKSVPFVTDFVSPMR